MSKKSRARAPAKAAGGASPVIAPNAFSARQGVLLAGGLVVLAALAVYYDSFSGPFIFDDRGAIADNPSIKRLGTALLPPTTATTGGRPILNLTFALNYALGGMKVWGYHAFNLLIHMLAGLTLFGLVRRTLCEQPTSNAQRPTSKSIQPPTSKSNGSIFPKSVFGNDATLLALAVAVIWVVYPLQTEAVTYISQRAEALMGLFYLLTLYCFVRGVEARKTRGQIPESRSQSVDKIEKQPGRYPLASVLWFLTSVISCLLGVMSKETIVTAPVIVFLYDKTFMAGSFRQAWRLHWRYYLGLAGTWLLLARLMTGLSQRGVGFDQKATCWTYALTSCRSVVRYLELAFWPHPLVIDYGTNIIQRPIEALPYALILAPALLAVGMALRYRPVLGFLGAWFFVILAPTSSVIPVAYQPMAEHRLYLSVAAVIVLGVLGLYRLIGRRSLLVCAAAAASLGWLSAQRNKDYRSELAIWNDAVAKCPDNERAYNSVGNVLMEMPGRLPEAISKIEAALRIKPDYAEAHYNLGVAFGKAGRMTEAMAQYEAALQVKPDYAEAHKNLGSALANIPGRLPEAIAHFEAALQIKPDDAEAHNNLGGALSNVPGRLPDAMAQLEAAVRINPDLVGAHYNLAVVLAKTPGRLSDAVAEYEAVLRLNPDDVEAYYNLGNILAKAPGRQSDAIAEYEAAVRINPGYLDAHCQLAILLAAIPGREADAISEYRAALRIRPDFAAVHLNLGVLLTKIPGRRSDAIAEYETALRINPNFQQAHTDLGIILETIPGRLPEAIAHFEAALRIAPDSPGARENLTIARETLQKSQNTQP